MFSINKTRNRSYINYTNQGNEYGMGSNFYPHTKIPKHELKNKRVRNDCAIIGNVGMEPLKGKMTNHGLAPTGDQ